MMWGLSLGLMGGDNKSLAPALTAVGPNTYLTRLDFLKMLGFAFAFHIIVFIIASLMPHEKVTNIPVRALSFKLGDQDRIAAFAPTPAPAAKQVAAPVMQASNDARVTAQTPPPAPRPVPVKPAKIEPVHEPKPQVVKPAPVPTLAPLPAVQQPYIPLPPAIAAQPQQYVREVGQPQTAAAGVPTGAVGGQGTVNVQTEQTSNEIRARYEQEISSWIQRHKLYPASAGGRAGRVVVRMRIDRGGVVRYYALEESSGVQALDQAALDMIRRANPVPAAPVNYPAGTLIEFLIPINFQAPQ